MGGIDLTYGSRVSAGSVLGALVVWSLTLAAHGDEPSAAEGGGWWEEGQSAAFPRLMRYRVDGGSVGVLYDGPEIDDTSTHPFFAQIGRNGRACVTCHQPSDGMSLSVSTIQKRWTETGGDDPLFAAIDGSDCPNLPQGEASSHSLLLEHGLFRIPLPWPPRRLEGMPVEPEFEIEVVRDPTGCNLDERYGLYGAEPTISVYRRPRPTANLRYVTTPRRRFNNKIGMPQPVDPDTGQRANLPILSDGRRPTLKAQAAEAAHMHLARAIPLTNAQLEEIRRFQSGIYMALDAHDLADPLVEPGGPKALGVKAMESGRAMVFANNWSTPVFHDFTAWTNWNADRTTEGSGRDAFRASAARGYDIFMERPLWISDTAHFNSIGMGNPYKRNCAICHNLQMTGNDISPGMIDIGVNNQPWALDNPHLPLFKLTCDEAARPHPYLGREVYTHDPGRALISGRCQDIGSLVMQQMRGLLARAPYFSNGSAKDLAAVVDYYDERFTMEMTDQEKRDLVNFLSVL